MAASKNRKHTRHTKKSSASSTGRGSRVAGLPRGKSRARAYEFLDHPADVGFVARGRTLKELFENAALAMLSYGWELATVRVRQRVPLSVIATDRESLLYAWLSEILSLADAHAFAFKKVTVNRITANRAPYEARGTLHGERFDRRRHRARTYIKAVTYHQLAVRQTPAGFTATVYLDV